MESPPTGARNKAMSPQELTTISAFALGLITCGLVVAAGVSLFRTTYTIAPRQVRKLKTRALKATAAAAVTGAAAVLLSTNF